MKTLLIDNYDSYSHLLAYHIWKASGEKPIILKNDELALEEISQLKFDKIVISPGPGHPDKKKDFGICKKLILGYKNKKPILGVCLGHQGIGSIFGYSIVKTTPAHGKISTIEHFGCELFEEIPKKFEAMRYHSLLLQEEKKSGEIEIIAKEASQGLIMGIKIKNTQIYGIQFHPESIGTSYGMKIIENFINLENQASAHEEIWKKNISNKKMSKKTFHFEELDSQLLEEEIFYKIYGKKKHAIWLDSSMKGESGKLSIMAAPQKLLYTKKNKLYLKKLKSKKKKQIKNSPFLFIQENLKKNKVEEADFSYDFVGGWMGYFSYEAASWLNTKNRFGEKKSNFKKKKPRLPEVFMMKIKHFLLFDHQNKKQFLASFSTAQSHLNFKEKVSKKLKKENKNYKKTSLEELDLLQEKNSLPIQSFFDEKTYFKKINKIKKKLKSGETYEICLTNEFSCNLEIEDFTLYQILRLVNPAPFGAYVKFGKNCIFSSSPERFVKLDNSGLITSEPIKGTRKNSLDKKENKKIASELLNSSKDRSELLMITDLIRNDLSKVSQKDSLRVENLFKISHYATLIQLSSVITAQLEENYDALNLFMSLFPGGSITGAPKERSMKIIKKLEKRKRGIYTGSIGYFSYNGAMDFSIAIRTIEKKKSKISFGAGGAITIDSNNKEEYDEMQTKAYALVKSLNLAATKFCKADTKQNKKID